MTTEGTPPSIQPVSKSTAEPAPLQSITDARTLVKGTIDSSSIIMMMAGKQNQTPAGDLFSSARDVIRSDEPDENESREKAQCIQINPSSTRALLPSMNGSSIAASSVVSLIHCDKPQLGKRTE